MNTVPVQYEQNTELFADYRTPYKYNRPILAPSGKPGTFDAIGVDNMRIFRHKGRFYATYIGCEVTMTLLKESRRASTSSSMMRSDWSS